MILDQSIFNFIYGGLGFIIGSIFFYYRDRKLTETINKIESEKTKLLSATSSLDPMVFQFHLLENTEYALSVTGMEGRHLNQTNHKKFMCVLKYLYDNEKLRTFPKQHEFNLLMFEKKE